MSSNNKKLVIAAVILCLVIGILAPFIASSYPDGLEKSAEQLMSNSNTEPAVNAPMSGYTIHGLGKLGKIVAIILGILGTLVIAYLFAMLLKRRNPPEASKELDFLGRKKL
ncbi:MAG: PDGLE domain-containing protein [Methanobacteriaceae archaeon]